MCHQFSHNRPKITEIKLNTLDADNSYTCYTCCRPSHHILGKRNESDENTPRRGALSCMADFIRNTLVQAFRTSIKLPGDSARCLSYEAYIAEFPSEVKEIHGLVYIGCAPAIEQLGVPTATSSR